MIPVGENVEEGKVSICADDPKNATKIPPIVDIARKFCAFEINKSLLII